MFIMYFAIPLSEIMRQIDNSEINDSLEFQRDFVWTNKKQQDLITTYQNKKGFGIVSFCRHSASEIWGILDGKQRATTFIKFIKGEFKDRDGKTFAEWSEGEKMRLLQVPIQICGYTLDTTIEDHSDLVEQFVLLNNSGQKLVDAELIYACDAPIRKRAESFFHSPLGADDIDDDDEQLREKWCQVFRNPRHFTKKLDIKALKQICGEHALDTGGKKFDLIARIEGNEGALIALRNHRSRLNDGIIPVTEQTRKNQYAITVPMMASACLNDFEAITGSFNKLKKLGAFGAEILSDSQSIARVHTCVAHWLSWVELQRNIEMPAKYKINHPKYGIPTLGKASISWAICLGSLATDNEDIVRTQCVHLFDGGNFAPLQVFYSKLSTELRWQFDVVQQASRGSMKQWITKSVEFIHQHCEQ